MRRFDVHKLIGVLPPILFIMGCRESIIDIPAEYTVKNYYPLAVGNEWTYQYTVRDHREWRDTFTLIIKESYKWNGKEVFVLGTKQSSGSREGGGSYLMYWNDKVIVKYYEPPETSEDTVALEEDTASTGVGIGKKYTIPLWEPLVKGRTWRGHRIERIDTTVRVAGKKFCHCIKVICIPVEDCGATLPPYPIFFAPKIGIVKWTSKERNPSVMWELIDYKVKV